MARHDDMPRHEDPTEIEPRPRPPPMRGPGATVAQLRQDIDSGATGEKVGMLDPAAVPLGTDAEAAGAPPTRAMVQAARDAERMADPPPGDPGKQPDKGIGRMILLGLALAVVLALAALWLG